MLVLLIRHAAAAEQNPTTYPDDTLRPLVAAGRRTQSRMSRTLLKRAIIPDRVFSSPWKRAWQTSRILLREMGMAKSQRVRCDALAAAPNLDAIAAEVGHTGGDETIALVGHEPWMSGLAALLLTGSESGLRIEFPKSGVVGIELDTIEEGGGTLRFFWTP